MEQLWARFFDAVIGGAIRTWVSISLVRFSILRSNHNTDDIDCSCFRDRYRIDLRNNSTSHPNPLSNHGPFGMSGDVRYGSSSWYFSEFRFERECARRESS